MNIKHHPDDATLVSYAAGVLSGPLALVVAVHLEGCPACASRIRGAESIGGALLDAHTASRTSGSSIERCWSVLQERLDNIAPKDTEVSERIDDERGRGVLAQHLPTKLEHLPWRRLSRHIYQYPLSAFREAKGWARLFLFEPGVGLPKHTHQFQEMSLVLQGAYCDELGRFEVGDVSDIDMDTAHAPVVIGDVPCIALIAVDGRIRFENPLLRLGAFWFGL